MLKKSEEDKILQTLKSCTDFGNAAEHYKELKNFGVSLKKNPQTSLMIRTFEALGNPDRIFILESLKKQDRCVCELESILQKSQPAISHHLKILRNSGLVCSIKDGPWVHYKLCTGKYNKYAPCVLKFVSECINNEQEFDSDRKEVGSKLLDCKKTSGRKSDGPKK